MKTKSTLEKVIEHTMQLISANENAAIEVITKTFESIHLIVTEHENELKQKIRAIDKRNRDQMEKFEKQLRNKQEKLNQSNRDFQDFLSAKDYTKLLLDHKESIKDLKTMTKRLNEVQYPIQFKYRVEGIDGIQQTIADILQQPCVYEYQQGNVNCIVFDTSIKDFMRR